MITHQSILDKISQMPGLITSLDEEFEEAIDYRAIREARVDNVDYAPNILPSLPVAVAVGLGVSPLLAGTLPVYQQLQTASLGPIGRGAHLSTAEPETRRDAPPRPPRERGDSTITLEQERELRDAVPLGRVLNLQDGDEYITSALTSNLLYTRKTPGLVVVTDKIEELEAVVKVARKHNIQLTAQGGGHSYASYSLNYCGILIDMSKFGNELIKIDLDNKHVTIPAGCRWEGVYDALRQAYPRGIVMGGKCKQVGVMGYLLGGGISPFSRSHGLLVDNITEMKIITPSEEPKLINLKPQDTDPSKENLYWALRGGGGGNFGILTEFTTKIHDLTSADGTVYYGMITWSLTTQQSDFQNMLKKLDSQEWDNQLTMDIIWQETWNKELQKLVPVGQLIVIFDGDEDAYSKLAKPWEGFNGEPKVDRLPWQNVAVGEQGWSVEAPAFHLHTSFVFKRGSLSVGATEETAEGAAEVITKVMNKSRNDLQKLDPKGKVYLICVHMGGEIASVAPKQTAFYWRNASYVCYFKLQWTKSGITDEMVKIIKYVNDALRPHTIDQKAAYVNFVDRSIPNWQEAYYGDNYQRLREVKQEWDPEGAFRFEQSIELLGATGTEVSPSGPAEIAWDRYSLPFPEDIWNVKVPKAPTPKERENPAVEAEYKQAREEAVAKIKGIIRSQMGTQVQ